MLNEGYEFMTESFSDREFMTDRFGGGSEVSGNWRKRSEWRSIER